MTISAKLKDQIEAAFDFRGHVTVSFADGRAVEGFLFNRQLEGPALAEPFIELCLKGSGDNQRFPVAGLASIELTGEDTAAGNSYEAYLKKKAAEKK